MNSLKSSVLNACYDDARNKYVRRANKDRGRSSMVRGSGSRRVKAVVPRGRGYKRIDNQVELRSGDSAAQYLCT